MSIRIARLILTGLSKTQLKVYMQKFGISSASGLRKKATSVLAKGRVKNIYQKPAGKGGMAEQQAKKAANPKYKTTRGEEYGQLIERPPANARAPMFNRKRKRLPQDDYYEKYRPGSRERDLD
jgi:hypothetical protein